MSVTSGAASVATSTQWTPSTADRRLAERLRARREALGLTYADVASRLGITPEAVARLETGRHPVSAASLIALARLLGSSLDQIVGESDGALSDVDERSWRDGVSPMWIAGAKSLLEFYWQLERDLGEEREVDVRGRWTASVSVEEAELLADEERRRLDLGIAPAHVLLSVLEERVGVRVLYADLGEAISGTSAAGGRYGPAIVVNARQAAGWRAFTLAHQLFHLLERGHGACASGLRSWHPCGARHFEHAAADIHEHLADRFALRLLVPPAALLRRVGLRVRCGGTLDRLELTSIARDLGVCVAVVSKQLAALNVRTHAAVTGDHCRREAVGVSPDTERAPTPQRFLRLVTRAYLSERISAGKLAELLGVDVLEVDELVSHFTDDLCADPLALSD